MIHEHLAREYEAWLKANPNVPAISPDEAVAVLRAQIDWLIDFIARWKAAK
jgi:hypothetical protein